MQSCVERNYQERVASNAMEEIQRQKAYYEQQLAINKSEFSCKKWCMNLVGSGLIYLKIVAVKSQLSALKKDLESIKTKHKEASEKLREKTRQYQKLQVSWQCSGTSLLRGCKGQISCKYHHFT